MTQVVPSETLSLLTRLSQKPGVQSTLVLERESGAIVHTSGFASSNAAANPNSTLPSATTETTPVGGGIASASGGRKESGIKSAEDVARLVYGFIESAGTLVRELEEEDEVKLLRLRTRKNELVVVPDTRFMIVVIHDTPPTA